MARAANLTHPSRRECGIGSLCRAFALSICPRSSEWLRFSDVRPGGQCLVLLRCALPPVCPRLPSTPPPPPLSAFQLPPVWCGWHPAGPCTRSRECKCLLGSKCSAQPKGGMPTRQWLMYPPLCLYETFIMWSCHNARQGSSWALMHGPLIVPGRDYPDLPCATRHMVVLTQVRSTHIALTSEK